MEFISKYKLSNSGIWVPSMSWEINGHLSEINLKNLGIPELVRRLKVEHSYSGLATCESVPVKALQSCWNS